MGMLSNDRFSIRRVFASLALLAALPLVNGCAETVIGGAAAGATAASQERGLGGAVGDTQIRTAINYLWLDNNSTMYHQLNLNVQEGRVLITGVVPEEQWRETAVKLAWRAKGIKEVIDEIIVDPKGTSGTYARDSWIATQIKTQLLFDKNIYSINYSLETVRGIVYVLGVAQDAGERDLVLQHCRNIEYVRRVVSYVLLKDDPRRQGLPPGTVTKGTGGAVEPGSATPNSTGQGGVPSIDGYGGTGGSSYTPPPPNGGSIQAVPLDAPPPATP